MKLVSLVGARPQFIKEAVLGAVARKRQAWEHVLVHSGQHYDVNMSDVFFDELGIPAPRYHLGVGSGTHGRMTAAALTGVEEVLLREKPQALLVYGDTNTTLAGALAAAKLHIPVVHVEAGIRMLPREMPEEINRVLTDRLAGVLCCCSRLGAENLEREGITQGVRVTGDIMYDVFRHMQPLFSPEEACARWGVRPGAFAVATLHRDYNVDTPDVLKGILAGLHRAHTESGHTILFCAHPRTRKRMEDFSLALTEGVRLLPPQGYLELMSLVEAAALVITDSGGLQKEAYYAGKRAVVVMPDAGWRELVDCGWNVLAAPGETAVAEAVRAVRKPMPVPPAVYGDGHAAERIVDAVLGCLER